MTYKFARNKLRIDIGTAHTAVNSAFWFDHHSDLTICGVEPNPINVAQLRSTPEEFPEDYRLSLDEGIISKGGKKICTLEEKNNKFILIEAAIDCGEPRKQKFYCTNEINRGCSSLYEPLVIGSGIETEEVIEVDTFSLDHLIEKLGWQHEMCIDYLKVDTQGNDLNVIKSCQKYLHLFAFIQVEFFIHGAYADTGEEKTEQEQFLKVMRYFEPRGFSPLVHSHTDAVFVNLQILEYILYHELDDKCHEWPHGWFSEWCQKNPQHVSAAAEGLGVSVARG